jgi:enoyl-CoA hydratase/carnithine racemase
VIKTVTISNPVKRNALDVAECERIVGELDVGEDVRVVVLTGDATGRAFCAGFDLGALADVGKAEAAFSAVIAAVSGCRVPVIAALNGAAIGGGCELAATCDLRVAHAGVKLGLPPAKLGIVYPERGLRRLAAVCGESRARQLFLLARVVDAVEAERWGLVDFVVEDVMAKAMQLAGEIAALQPHAVQGMRARFEARFAAQRPKS